MSEKLMKDCEQDLQFLYKVANYTDDLQLL